MHFQADQGHFLIVGLDPDASKIPAHIAGTPTGRIVTFCKGIIDATHGIVAGYKPNIAFYEAYGVPGMEALAEIISYIRKTNPQILVILDAKRGDIENTNAGYVQSAFERFGADAITIHPYMGRTANVPFMNDPARGVFVLCATSNKGAGEFQDLALASGEPLFMRVARNVADSWNGNATDGFRGTVGLVAGATYPERLAAIRSVAPIVTILIPGVGAQGGDLEKAVRAGKNSNNTGFLVNSSRAILYASPNLDYAEAAYRIALETHQAITAARVMEAILPPSEEAIAQQILAEKNAVLTGHFVYTAGDHGSAYVNKDAVYTSPAKTEQLCTFIAKHFQYQCIDVVIGPEKGGIILSQYVAKHLSLLTGADIPAIYAEKSDTGFVVKRGYDAYIKDKNILVVEDILNTGTSVKNVIALVESHGGNVVGVGALCNRGNVTSEELNVQDLYSTINITLEKYPADTCPLCANKVPINTEVGKGKEFLARQAETAS